MKSKHLKLASIPRRCPIPAAENGVKFVNPCEGLTGIELKKCEYKAYKGGVVY